MHDSNLTMDATGAHLFSSGEQFDIEKYKEFLFFSKVRKLGKRDLCKE